ncbi:multicopper oxidase family protein [Telmatospirillum sp. J64-1]|uniref:multicopper oxidase family protein n=1 Tax=Telmatospirillum sp. J64-1 TaxID=2502183 RepID=UPI00115E3315|nr:multicopper oxidase domain-containing protein [Telmatospirillum sp. J64-1]
MQYTSRRQFLASVAATSALVAAPSLLFPTRAALAASASTIRVDTRVIEVNGRAATVFGLTQPDGTHGLVTEAGQRFRVRLENRLDEETLIHWHGLTPPWQQDGVPQLSQPPLAPGAAYDYDFPLDRPGTNWMHSHHGLQEQRLMAAPLIVRDPAEAGTDIQDVVVLFHDFTFRDPDEILAGLRGGGHGGAGHVAAEHRPGLLRRMMETVMPMRGMDHGAGHGGMDHGAMGAGMVHLHDVDYDAFLANDRTLDDPEVFRVERGGRVRLRLINGATATNFWLDLGRLEGRLVAVDGMPVAPVTGRRFEFAIAQRLDILLDLPAGEGTWPVFAVREGERARTGFILATPRGTVERVAGDAAEPVQAVGLALERRLRATQPLALQEADRRHTVTITEAPGYIWMLNGASHGDHAPLDVRAGERVEITFNDQTTMAHPMHLHGHHFQVVAINGERFAGAVRDTVLVPARGSVTIAFDATNPGKWALHCHHLYHMAGGMMTTVEYDT